MSLAGDTNVLSIGGDKEIDPWSNAEVVQDVSRHDRELDPAYDAPNLLAPRNYISHSIMQDNTLRQDSRIRSMRPAIQQPLLSQCTQPLIADPTLHSDGFTSALQDSDMRVPQEQCAAVYGSPFQSSLPWSLTTSI